jgi:hypothetical protein
MKRGYTVLVPSLLFKSYKELLSLGVRLSDLESQYSLPTSFKVKKGAGIALYKNKLWARRPGFESRQG